MTASGRLASSRASTSFWALPPDRLRTGAPGPAGAPPTRQPRRHRSPAAAPAGRHGCRGRARGCRPGSSGARARSGSGPTGCRRCARAMRSRGTPCGTTSPSTTHRAGVGRLDTRRARASSSACPLPSTPATPSTSPAAHRRSRRRAAAPADVLDGEAHRGVGGHGHGFAHVAGPTSSRPTMASASVPTVCSLNGVRRPARPRRRAAPSPGRSPSTTSRSRWVMITTARPSSARRRHTASSPSASAPVSTAVGSSSRRTAASASSARRISRRCCSPTASWATGTPSRTSSPKRSTSTASRCPATRAGGTSAARSAGRARGSPTRSASARA